MEEENGYKGKQILIVFTDGTVRDGTPHYTKREGMCTHVSSEEIGLDNKHFIPRKQIVRVEVRE